MSKKSMGIRARRTTNGVVELWLGEPGDPESDCIFQAHKDYLPGVLHALENIEKTPVVESTWHYPVRK